MWANLAKTPKYLMPSEQFLFSEVVFYFLSHFIKTCSVNFH